MTPTETRLAHNVITSELKVDTMGLDDKPRRTLTFRVTVQTADRLHEGWAWKLEELCDDSKPFRLAYGHAKRWELATAKAHLELASLLKDRHGLV